MNVKYCLFIILCIVNLNSSAQTLPGDSGSEELFIWFKKGKQDTLQVRDALVGRFPELSHRLSQEKAFQTDEDPLNRIWLLSGFSSANLNKYIEVIKGIDVVELVEAVPLFKFDYTPDDIQYRQWNLRKIQAEYAWNLSKGGPEIVVALIDNGLDTAHEDIQPLLWHNKKEIYNKLDDDGNGYVDDVFGWDIADNDNDPSVVITDTLIHGTHCAGIISAKTNNSKGIAGLGYQCSIMPVKVGQTGNKFLVHPYRGVEYAINNGAKVISMSWGSRGNYSSTYQSLFQYAYKKGVFCVASAGNDYDSLIHYPAGYKYVLSVGSTDSFDKKSWFSCYGSWVDVMAPGSDILSTLPGNQYGNFSGTSMACPLVSGLVGLMYHFNPTQTIDEVEKCIKSGCVNIDNLNTGYSGQLGAGRIDAYASLRCVKTIRAIIASSKTRLCPGDTVSFFDSSRGKRTSWTWSFPGGVPSSSTIQNPIVRYISAGTYSVKLIVSDGVNTDSVEQINYISVGKPTVKFKDNQTIAKGDYGTITAKFTGSPPWNLSYTDGKDTFNIYGILSDPYFILVQSDSTKTYYPVSVDESGCMGSVSDSFVLTVLNHAVGLCDSAARYYMRWGGNADDQLFRAVEYDDTTLIIAGKTKSYGPGNFTSFVAKISVNGHLFWFKTYGGSSEDGFFALTLDGNKDIHVGGYTFSGTSQKSIYFMKLSKNGNILWKKHYDGSSLELMRSSVLSRDKKYIIYGGPSISNSYGYEDYTMIKVDTAGTVNWIKQIGDNDFNRNDGIWEDSTGNLYMAGIQGNNFPYVDAGLTKISSNGSVVWSKRYAIQSGGYNEMFEKIVGWKERALFACGFAGKYNGSYSSKELWLCRLNLDGSLVWAKRFTLGDMGVCGLAISGDHIYLSGETYNNGGDAYVFELDTSGRVLKSVSLGNNNEQVANDIVVSRDGGFYILGSDNSSGNQDIMIAKSNCKLDFLCNVKKVTPTVTAESVNSSSVSLSAKDFNYSKTVSVTTSSYAPTIGFLCKIVPDQKKTQCNLDAEFQIVPACTGNEVLFKDLTIDYAGYEPALWQWDFGDKTKYSGNINVKHTYKKNGQYQVTLIVQSIKNGYSCLDTIVNNFRSTDSFIMVSMISDTIICAYDSVQLGEPKIRCGVEPYFYTWWPSAGISDTSDKAPWFSPLKPTVYHVRVRDYNGNWVEDSFLVKINNACCISTARFEIDPNHTCVNVPVKLINTSTYKKNAIFKWHLAGASVSDYTGFEPSGIYYTQSGLYPVILTLSDSCSNDTFESEIYIADNPKAFAGNDTAICYWGPLNIGSGGLDGYRYSWIPKTGMANPFLPDPVVDVNKNIVYHLRVESDYGCFGEDSIAIILLEKSGFLGNDTSFCEHSNAKLSSRIYADKFLWNTGETTRSIVVSNEGEYILQITNGTCIYSDSVFVHIDTIQAFTLGRDTSICINTIPLKLKPNPGILYADSLQWNDGTDGSTLNVSLSGFYWLKIKTGRCRFADSVQVTIDTLPLFRLFDTTVCSTDLPLNVGLLPNSNWRYMWNTGDTQSKLSVVIEGQYILTVFNGQCRLTDSVNVVVDQFPAFNLGTDTIICSSDLPYTLWPRGNIPLNSKYLWDNGTTKSTRIVADSGTFYLVITNGVCSEYDSVHIDTLAAPVVKLIRDTSICKGDTLNVNTGYNSNVVTLWNTGSDLNSIRIVSAGLYWVVVSNDCGKSSDSIKVLEKDCSCPIYIPNSFTPLNSKNLNDEFSVVFDCPVEKFEIEIYNRWGSLIFKSNDPDFHWDGKVSGRVVPAGAYYGIVQIQSKHENGGRKYYKTGMIYVLD